MTEILSLASILAAAVFAVAWWRADSRAEQLQADLTHVLDRSDWWWKENKRLQAEKARWEHVNRIRRERRAAARKTPVMAKAEEVRVAAEIIKRRAEA